MKLDYKGIETKWRKIWEATSLYKVTEDPSKPKYYVLDMFPYPSGSGLHVGHPLGYVASDIFSRYMRKKGYNVLHPMGYDAFGLPAEQYALDTGVHPAKSTSENIIRFREQLDNIGLSYDWSREVRTDDPKFYKWTQWIFLQLFDHYYDTQLDKAQPISRLIAHFEKSGSRDVHAVHSNHAPFDAQGWKAMTALEQSQVLMNYRLAYRKVGYVNWCEALGTVLANDEVKDGVSERGGFPVVQKEMLQWSLRITAYAERMLKGMETLEWNESLKTIQRNWIGRSEGAYIDFQVDGHADLRIKIFTTRPDTIFGATFIVLAPDHSLVHSMTSPAHKAHVDAFLEAYKIRSGEAKANTQKTLDGIWLGTYVLHPVTGDRLPVWIADYVLKEYGTGTIMAVPGDDERDYHFAKHHALPVIDVIDRSGIPNAQMEDRQGTMIHSSFLDGMSVEQAITTILDYLEKKGLGKRQVEYKLRDANFSRQRYWGEPFPIFYDHQGIAHAMTENELPHVLPDLDDFKPSPDGRSPLARLTSWSNPGPDRQLETDTMPGYAGSSWYFLRYMDPHEESKLASEEKIKYWRDVDLYVGGVEHAVGHLMYSRFWHKFLYDLNIVPTEEPFKKMVNQGMIQGIVENVVLMKSKKDGKAHFISAELISSRHLSDDQVSYLPISISFVTNYGQPHSYLNAEGITAFVQWRPEFADAYFECADGFFTLPQLSGAQLQTYSEVGKMSKRYHNVVNPNDVIDRYGADCFRMYEMFLGPVDQSKPWDTMGIEGVSKFLKKCWSLYVNDQEEWQVTQDEPKDGSFKILHATIKKTQEDIERLSFNTAISQFMICVNELRKNEERSAQILEPLVSIVSPFAPFLAEELWAQFGHSTSVHTAPFPSYDEQWLIASSITYPVCINGKKRSEIILPAEMDPKAIEAQATVLPEIVKWMEGKPIRKVIIVPDKMINIVV